MANNGMFMSPRSDLTIRNLTAEQIEKIANFAVDTVGGVVSFSESAIYESEDTTSKRPIISFKKCPYDKNHNHHRWLDGDVEYDCPGRLEGVYG